MKKIAVLVAAGLLAAVALSQEAATTQTKPKPAAGRIAASSAQDEPQLKQRPTTTAPATDSANQATYSGTSQATYQETSATATASTQAPAQPPQQNVQLSVAAPARPDEVQAAASSALLPEGTTIRMKLETALSTVNNKAGDTFAGRVTEPVMLEGKTIVPVGASVEGRVVHVSDPRRIHGVPTMDLRPETITLPDGQRFVLNAVLVDTSDPKHLDVDNEGRIQGHGHDGTDTRNLAIGAGAGAGIGALITRTPKGALIGAGVGVVAATAKWLMTRHEAQVPAGTEIFMELSRPLTLSAMGTAAGGR